MVKLIKKFWWIPAIVLLVAGFLQYDSCQNKKLEEAKQIARQIQTDLGTAIAEKNKIWGDYQAELNKPPKVIVRTEVEYITVEGKPYVTKEQHLQIVAEWKAEVEMWKAKFDLCNRSYTLYRRKDVASGQQLMDSIYKLNGKLNSIKPIKLPRWGIGLFVGYCYMPQHNEFGWSIGVGVYYRILGG